MALASINGGTVSAARVQADVVGRCKDLKSLIPTLSGSRTGTMAGEESCHKAIAVCDEVIDQLPSERAPPSPTPAKDIPSTGIEPVTYR